MKMQCDRGRKNCIKVVFFSSEFDLHKISQWSQSESSIGLNLISYPRRQKPPSSRQQLPELRMCNKGKG